MRYDPEAALLNIFTASRLRLAGEGHRERNAVAQENDRWAPPAQKTAATHKRVSDAERAEMARLYRELGEQERVCSMIAGRLTVPRSVMCVANVLTNDGVRPSLTTAQKRERRSAAPR